MLPRIRRGGGAERRRMTDLPPDEVMKQMAKLSYEVATENLAKFAEQFATEMDAPGLPPVTGPAALRAFAAAIRSTNQKRYPRGPEA